MKRKTLLLILLLALGVPIAAWSQQTIYQENFDSYVITGSGIVLPTGWTSQTVGGSGAFATVKKNLSGSVHAYSAPNYFVMGNEQALSSNSSVGVTLPSFTMPVNCTKLSFRVKSSFADMGNNSLMVRYSYRDLSGNHTVTAFTCNASTTYPDQPVSVSFNQPNIPSDATISFVFVGHANAPAGTCWYIDDVVVENDLQAPTNLSVSNITGTTASLSWTLNGNGGSGQVMYSTASDFSNPQYSTNGSLSNLQGYTTYYAKVRARARLNANSPWVYGPWSEPIEFTTLCAVPTNVQVYPNPAEGVTVSWEGNANSYHIQYENIETWQSAYHNGLVTATGNSYTFTGTESVPVVPGMRYILRVQAQCDPSTASEWSEWVEFTNCLTYMNLPLHANFDYIPTNWSSLPHADLPGCWSRINSSADPNYKNYPCIENNQSLCHSNYYPQGLYNYIRFNIPENGPDQYLVLPPVDPVNDVTISFWVRSASSETSYSYNIGLMPNNYSTDDFYVKDGYNLGGANTDYIQNTYTFTAQEMASNGNYIVIWARSSSTTATSFCIDDIDIYPANYHCGEPVNVHAENIGATLAHIVWENPVTGGGEWSVRYKKATDEDWTYKYDGGLVSLGCDLDNLESNTTYTVAVRDNCNDIDHSEWVEATFTTLDVIPVPTNLHVFTDYLGNQHIGSSWVDLAWDCTPVEGQSEVDRYGLEVSDDGETWYGPMPNAYWGTVATQCIVDPISPGTHYVRVRAIDSDDNEGNWSEPLQFNIEECDEVVTIQPGDSSETYDFNECPPLPDCWTVYGDIPYGVFINYNALYFDFRGNVEAKYVELEEFLVTEDYSGLVVSFDWRHAAPVADNTTNMTVQLQYCLGHENENWQNAGEPISVFKDGLTEPQWSTYTRMIPYGYWTRLRLKYTITDYQEFSYGTNPYCLIDNLVITGRPYCSNPTKWRVVPETYGGRVIWDKVAAAMSYDIAYQVDGDAEWESVEGVEGYEYTADSLFFDMTGLLANTTYRVKMKSECSNQWPGNYVTFTTSDFGSFNELMYTFEEGMPADFSVSGAGAANVSVSTEQSFGADPHSLKYDFVSGSPYPSQALAYVEIGNCLNTRGFNDFLVYFDMYCTDVANTYETVYLQYKAFGSDGWEEDWRMAGSWYTSYDSQGWVERHATFSIPTELQESVSKLRFRLVFTDHGSGESTYIDNLRIFPKGSCNNVSGIVIVALESTSATFRWNDPNYEAGTTQSVGFTLRYRNLTIPTETYTGWIEIPVWVDASNPTQQYSITLNELDPSSYYVFDIRTLCSDGGYTVWSSLHQHFVTDCQPYELNDMEPFVEDFNDIDLACWTYNTRWGRIYDGHGGSNWSLRSNKLDVSGWNDYIDTPEIELDPNYVSKGSSYLVLRFWTKCSSGDGTGNKVKVLVGNQEVEIYEMPAYGCDQWQQVDLSLSRWLPDNNGSNTISVRFDHGSDATAEWFIDDVVITSWDEANYGNKVFDDAPGGDHDWTNDNNWYPEGAPTNSSSSWNVTLMSTAWVPANSTTTVGTMRFGTQGYLDVQPGSNLTITTVDIPENKVFVEPGATLNIGTAHFSFDKVFHQVQEGIYNITNLNNNDHWLSFNYGTTILGTVTLTSPGKITVLNTWNATTVNSSGQFEVYPDANVTIGTLNAAEVSPLGFLIQGTANITTLNASGETAVLVQDGGMLNATTIVNTNHNALVIEDGGQVKSANSFNGIIRKNITGYGAGNESLRSNWYLIASPIAATVNTTLVPEISDELDFDMVDFYMFDQGQALEWENVKCDVEGGCASPYGTYPTGSIYAGQMVNAQEGYLYACQDDYTASFSTGVTGNAFPATNVDIASRNGLLGYSADADFAGWNLIGNPYTCNAYLKQDDNYIPFYRMNATGDAIVGVPAGTPIKPCEGVFVCCTEPSSTVTFTTTAPASTGEPQSGPAIVLPMHFLLENQDASLASQTIALYFASGWNWWAPIVQITAAQLRTALNPNLQHLMSKTGEVASDAVLEPGQMYRIQTNTAVDGVTITGVPTAASISIGEDFNWIGYTGGTTDGISAALASYGITPNIGDKIISQDGGFAIYNGTTWEGTLTQLTQGQGYVYVR